jgi:hypothetical protein
VFVPGRIGLGATFRYAEGEIFHDSGEVYRQWQPAAIVS